MNGLAVSTAQRSLLLPGLATMIGYPTFNMPGWGGFLATAGTPKDAVEKLNAEGAARCAAAGIAETVDRGRHGTATASESSGVRKFVENDIRTQDAFVEAVGVEKLKGDVPAQ